MDLRGLSGGLYQPLSPENIETIHEASLTILEKTGITYEIIGMCCKVLKGIQVDDEHLALETIDAVGPGGTFITSAHTMAHMHDEFFQGNGITDQNSRDIWEEKGEQDARTRAREIAKTILAQEEKSYISIDVEQAIRKKYEILL